MTTEKLRLEGGKVVGTIEPALRHEYLDGHDQRAERQDHSTLSGKELRAGGKGDYNLRIDYSHV